MAKEARTKPDPRAPMSRTSTAQMTDFTRDGVICSTAEIGVPRSQVRLPPRFIHRDIMFRYDQQKGYFLHNLRDLHIFCVWEKARHLEDIITQLLSAKFSCLHVGEVTWSLNLSEQNFGRLYKTLGRWTNNKHRSVGSGPFLCIIVEDLEPKYYYELSVSGVLELCNRNVLEVKREMRSWLGGFLIHSTGNPTEFFEQANLFFPPHDLIAILQSDRARSPRLEHRDPVGSNGWLDLDSLFEHLNRTTDYVILRGFKDLLEQSKISRLDILCSDPESFFSGANAITPRKTERDAWCQIKVGNSYIDVRLSFVGDGSLDVTWQKDILERSNIYAQLIKVPREDDYFFSLLCYVASLRQTDRNVHLSELRQVGSQIGIPEDLLTPLPSTEGISVLLRSFFKGSKYSYFVSSSNVPKENRRVADALGRMFVIVYSHPRPSVIEKVRSMLFQYANKAFPLSLSEIVPASVRKHIWAWVASVR